MTASRRIAVCLCTGRASSGGSEASCGGRSRAPPPGSGTEGSALRRQGSPRSLDAQVAAQRRGPAWTAGAAFATEAAEEPEMTIDCRRATVPVRP
jgi:hypothetical protein